MTAPDYTALCAQAEAALPTVKRLRRYDWQDWAAVDVEDAAQIVAGVPALIARIRELEGANRELALDVIAADGQAQEAYEAQLAAEAERDEARAKLAEVEKERDEAREEAGIQMRHLQVLADSLAASEAKLATCEKYRDAYAECDRIASQAVRDLEATVATLTAQVEAIRGGGVGEDQRHSAA